MNTALAAAIAIAIAIAWAVRRRRRRKDPEFSPVVRDMILRRDDPAAPREEKP